MLKKLMHRRRPRADWTPDRVADPYDRVDPSAQGLLALLDVGRHAPMIALSRCRRRDAAGEQRCGGSAGCPSGFEVHLWPFSRRCGPPGRSKPTDRSDPGTSLVGFRLLVGGSVRPNASASPGLDVGVPLARSAQCTRAGRQSDRRPGRRGTAARSPERTVRGVGANRCPAQR